MRHFFSSAAASSDFEKIWKVRHAAKGSKYRERYQILQSILLAVVDGKKTKTELQYSSRVPFGTLLPYLQHMVDCRLVSVEIRPRKSYSPMLVEEIVITEKGRKLISLLSDLSEVLPWK